MSAGEEVISRLGCGEATCAELALLRYQLHRRYMHGYRELTLVLGTGMPEPAPLVLRLPGPSRVTELVRRVYPRGGELILQVGLKITQFQV